MGTSFDAQELGMPPTMAPAVSSASKPTGVVDKSGTFHAREGDAADDYAIVVVSPEHASPMLIETGDGPGEGESDENKTSASRGVAGPRFESDDLNGDIRPARKRQTCCSSIVQIIKKDLGYLDEEVFEKNKAEARTIRKSRKEESREDRKNKKDKKDKKDKRDDGDKDRKAKKGRNNDIDQDRKDKKKKKDDKVRKEKKDDNEGKADDTDEEAKDKKDK